MAGRETARNRHRSQRWWKFLRRQVGIWREGRRRHHDVFQRRQVRGPVGSQQEGNDVFHRQQVRFPAQKNHVGHRRAARRGVPGRRHIRRE